MMNRRDFFRSSATAAAWGVVGQGTTMLGENSTACPPAFPHVEGLTRYVGEFIINTKYENILRGVIELGKKDILDGFGLALSGSVGETGPLVHKYLEQVGFQPGRATVAGTAIRVPPRFAGFANGVAIHNVDFDDTQLAAAKDRVSGLLTHPTAPVLSAALALAETKPVSGRDLRLRRFCQGQPRQSHDLRRGSYQIPGECRLCQVAEAEGRRPGATGAHAGNMDDVRRLLVLWGKQA